MTIYDKNGIHRKTVFNHLLRRFCAGASAVKDCRPSNLLMVALYALMSALVWEFGGSLLGLDGGRPPGVCRGHYGGCRTAGLHPAGLGDSVCAYGNAQGERKHL